MEAIARTSGYLAIGRGDSIAAINKYVINEEFPYTPYICTGGDALIRLLSG